MNVKKLSVIIMTLVFALSDNACFSKGYVSENSIIYGQTGGPAGNVTGYVPPAEEFRIPIVADHNCVDVDAIPAEWVEKAIDELHIAYGHTSHGSQIVSGMIGMTGFKKDPFIYKKGAADGSLDLRDNPFNGDKDLGAPDNKTWAQETRTYLQKNKDINVVIWSWCGQLSSADGKYVQNYLNLMQGLEKDFPEVTFVYMTGHLDGTGENGTLAKNNNQIRQFCLDNDKVLYDFADIESYNPDGVYYGDRYANDGCWYDSNGDKQPDKNWAQEWQKTHSSKEWYGCDSAHSEPLNANMKAAAMWWLLARITGYSGDNETSSVDSKTYEYFGQKMQSLKFMAGTDRGLALEETPTRLQSVVMLTRLKGGETEAKNKKYSHPFTDVPWGSEYVGYMYRYKLTSGTSATKFGSNTPLEAKIYMTFILRVLGYSDNAGDFAIDSALETGRRLGLISQSYLSGLKSKAFTRGDMAKLTCLALKQKLKGKNTTLLEELVSDGAVDSKAAQQFLTE